MQEFPFNHCAAAYSRPDGEIKERGEPLGGTPACLTQGSAVHIGIKANRQSERLPQPPDHIGASPAGLGGCQDVPVSGGGGGWVERSKAGYAQAAQLAQGSALRLEEANGIAQGLVRVVVGKRVSANMLPSALPTAQTNFVPPPSIAPNKPFVIASPLFRSGFLMSYKVWRSQLNW